MNYLLRRALEISTIKSGAISALWRWLPNGVYVFNYHRIGDKHSSQFDRRIFSCSTDAFEQQLKVIRTQFEVINTDQLSKLIENGECQHAKYALITFDDGYSDNYSEAFPILSKLQLPGVFFISTNHIESSHVPWWDEIAFLIRSSIGESFTIPDAVNGILITPENADQCIYSVIYQVKQLKHLNAEIALERLRRALPSAYTSLQDNSKELFMNWAQVKELHENDMEIGSHTVSHNILSNLTTSQQSFEIQNSKLIIEENIGAKVNALAYPVGRERCYNETSLEIAQKSGYTLAFNNMPGVNKKHVNPLDLYRICIDSNDLDQLKFNCFIAQRRG